MAFPIQLSLILKLESSEIAGIHAEFSNYLSGFTSVDQIPFLNNCIDIIPKRVQEISMEKLLPEKLLLELLKIYKLCLDCLDRVSSQLNHKDEVYEVN